MKWGVRRNKISDKPKNINADKKRKIAVGVGVGVAGAALAGHGAYKVSKHIKNNDIRAVRDKGKAVVDRLMLNNKNDSSSMSRSIKSISSDTLTRGKEAVSRLKINMQLFGHKKEFKSRAHRMPKVVSEVMTNATNEQRKMPSYTKNIGGYKYLVINRPGDTPIVKQLYKITKTIHDK